MHLWCWLIEHAQTTLNLLHLSRITPLISAEAVLNGPFDYNKTPLDPPGTKVAVYEKPEVRGTWSPYGVDGWYISSAHEHYQCHRVYIIKIQQERIARIIQFVPYQTTMPTTLSAKMVTEAAIQLTDAILHPTSVSPFTVVPTQLEALCTLAAIYDCALHHKESAKIQPSCVPISITHPRSLPAQPVSQLVRQLRVRAGPLPSLGLKRGWMPIPSVVPLHHLTRTPETTISPIEFLLTTTMPALTIATAPTAP